MTNRITEQDLELIKTGLSSRFPLQKIILFGSQATGCADNKSDIDLLIISDFKGNRRQLMVEMNRTLDNVAHAVDLLILRPDEYDQEKHIPGTIARYAGQEGRVIYERPA